MKETDPAKKTEALRLLEDGKRAADVARQLGVPAGTVRSWAHRVGHAGPPSGADPLDWAEEKEAGAREAWATAQEALARVRSLLAEGSTADAQRAALTMAILTDKSGVLEESARREQERQVRIAEGQAALIAEIIRMYFDSVGLSLGPAAKKTLAGLLLQAKEGTPLSAPADAEEARRDIRKQVVSQLAEVPQLPPAEDDGPRGLPAPRDY